ncbi:MAG: hypothetical protein ACOCV2_04920 [Persicimonas sp.]
MAKPTYIRRFVALFVASILALAMSGCGYDGGGFGAAGEDGYYNEPYMTEALSDLSEHRVDKAREHYDDGIQNYEPVPGAYVGRGLTTLMLVAGSDPVTDLLTSHFDVDSGIEANEAIFADEGYIYWLVRGVSWQDDGEYAGIATHIAEHLPFSAERIATLEDFFGGVDAEADPVADDLVEVADHLGSVEDDLQTAVEALDYEAFYLPGRTFHDDQLDQDDSLDMLFTRADIHQIAALVEAVRGAIYLTAAYENDWTLQEPFNQRADAEDDDTDQSSTTLSDALEYIDPYLGRGVDNADYLEMAREAFDSSLSHFASAIEAGLDQDGESTFDWQEADEEHARNLADFADALREALEEPTDLPHTSPSMEADFSPIFEGERTLEEGIAWFEPTEDDDHSLRVTNRAVQAFFVDDLIEPGFVVGEDDPDWPIGGERLDTFYDAVFGKLVNGIENAFFSTR